jgi:CRP-like cAMP-binding protein
MFAVEQFGVVDSLGGDRMKTLWQLLLGGRHTTLASRFPAMTSPIASLETNLLIASLPAKQQRRLLRRLEAVAIQTNEDLYESGQPIRYVYFPTKGCLISVITELGDGKTFDAVLIGYEGLAGVEAFLGVEKAQFGVTVRIGGRALRMETEVIGAELRVGGCLSEVIHRYVQFLLLAFSQKAGCNCFHSLERHLCSWLLRIQDHTQADAIEITHEVLAKMLGVRRVGISQAARKLMEAGLIRYSWGKLTILDRKRLEEHACVCHERITQAYERLLDPAWPYL